MSTITLEKPKIAPIEVIDKMFDMIRKEINWEKERVIELTTWRKKVLEQISFDDI